MENNTTISMSKLAGKLASIGRNKLYKFLRDINILDEHNLPKGEFRDSPFFKINYSPTGLGEMPTTYITPVGELFIKTLLKVKGEVNGNK